MEPDDHSPKPGKLFANDCNALHQAMGQYQSHTINQTENPSDTNNSSQMPEYDMLAPEAKVARYLEEKQKEQPVRKNGPLNLLDLPLDNLKDILKEVTHTNDLANLALVNSALHGIVTPLIYSRFDIVWPDTNSSAEPRAGVDALTYGLATLVMREDLFDNMIHPSRSPSEPCPSYSCMHCGCTNYLNRESKPLSRTTKTRRGNYYSQFTKKFSLGNGPAEWVQEYLVTKESGKMLGTLVALGVARMPNLETFIWDMPTGILRDIWIALASLGDYKPSKLEKLWVRLHDNKAALQEAGLASPANTQHPAPVPAPPGPPAPSLPTQPAIRSDAEMFGVSRVMWSNHHVEKPNFSILPALKSLTVLDVDEVNYLIQLSVLLGRSVSTLRELRLGMASTLHMSGYTRDVKEISHLFTGGVFSLLMSKIYDHTLALEVVQTNVLSKSDHKQTNPLPSASTLITPLSGLNINPTEPGELHTNVLVELNQEGPEASLDRPSSRESELDENAIDPALFDTNILTDEDSLFQLDQAIGQGKLPENQPGPDPTLVGPPSLESTSVSAATNLTAPPENSDATDDPAGALRIRHILDPIVKMRLETLEIERVTLQSQVLQKAIDFTMLTSLTLLNCGDSTSLWEELKRNYGPRKSLISSTHMRTPSIPSGQSRLRRKPSSESLSGGVEYRLKLKKIHTDSVSKELISFLKTTLAPNSLEWMFLRENGTSPSTVSIHSIYRGPLRRHRASLTKIMVDSAYGSVTSRARSVAARKWIFNREILAFVTSGKMTRLRELAMAIEYRDWHFFLQKLPQIPHLRSLYLPFIADHSSSFSPREAAMGAVDVVAIKPIVQLCYLAIKNKCFEILEKKTKPKTPSTSGITTTTTTTTTTDETDSDDQSEDHDNHDDDDDDDSENGGPAPPAPNPAPQDADWDDASDRSPDTDDDDDNGASGHASGRNHNKVKFRLREILFYDDKISIFKARHGRL